MNFISVVVLDTTMHITTTIKTSREIIKDLEGKSLILSHDEREGYARIVLKHDPSQSSPVVFWRYAPMKNVHIMEP